MLNGSFVFLHITTENGITVAKHIADAQEDDMRRIHHVHIKYEHVIHYGLPSADIDGLIKWVKTNQPTWNILRKKISYASLLDI